MAQNELYHYGMPRRSGRYPWGSGERPFQSSKNRGNYKLKKYTSPFRMEIKDLLLHVSTLGISDVVYQIKNFNSIRPDLTDYTIKEGPFGKLKDLKKKTQSSTPEEDMEKVNFKKGSRGRVNNCALCTVAYDMRRRGYDVQARSIAKGLVPQDVLPNWYKNPKFIYPEFKREKGESRKTFVKRTYEELSTQIEKLGDGARGYLSIRWEGTASGHAVAWEVSNKQTTFYDAQSGKIDPYQIFTLCDPKFYMYVRLDNLKLKDEITEGVMNRNDERK